MKKMKSLTVRKGIVVIFSIICFLSIVAFANLSLPDSKAASEKALGTREPASSAYGIYANNIAISPATPKPNYAVRVDLDARFNYSRCQAAGQDIRFFDGSNNLLPFWIETWNDRGKSTIWVKILTSGTTSMVLRYGNATAPAASNGNAVFLLFDDFSGASLNATKWTQSTTAFSTITQANGLLTLSSDTGTSWTTTTQFGFHNNLVSGGATVQGASIIGNTGSVSTSNGASAQGINCYYLQSWLTFDMRWINSTLAKFQKNNLEVASFTQYLPPSNLPVRFFARAVSNGGGTHYGAWVTSVNTTIGRPGNAVRMRIWNDYSYVFANTRGAQMKVDWVCVHQVVANEPVASVTYYPQGNYLVRKLVSINPATPVANFTVKLALNSTFNYERCAPDGADIRVYSMSNVSQAYWIEKWNDAGNSTIWINVGQSGTTSLQLEYGDKTRASTSNGNATFLFFDDFIGSTLDTTNKWTKLEESAGAIWQDPGLTLAVFEDSNSANPNFWPGNNGLVIATKNNIGSTYSACAKMKFSDAPSVSSFSFDTLADTNNALFSYFDYNAGGSGKTYANSQIITGTGTPLTNAVFNFNTSAWYNYQFMVTGSSATGSIYASNDLLAGQHLWSGSSYCFQKLGINLNQQTNTAKAFGICDWVYARKYAATEPLASLSFAGTPGLINGGVTPPTGNQSTPFTFSVTYKHGGDILPSYMRMNINGTQYAMAKKTSYSFDYVNGVSYYVTIYLQPGTYTYFFSCQAMLLSNTTATYGLTVSVAHARAPVLNAPSVSRQWGYNTSVLQFMVNYTDADNFAPSSITVSLNATPHAMTKVNASDTRYNDGCFYQAYVTLQIGTYTYGFNASDGAFSASLGPYSGITIVANSLIDENFQSYGTGGVVDTFDEFAIGTTVNGGSWTDVTVAGATSTVQLESSSKKLDQNDASTTGYGDSHWTIPASYSTTGWNWISFDCKKTATTGRSQAWIYDLSANVLVEINFENDGFIRFNGGMVTLQAYSASVNYHVTLFFNLATDRSYVSINSTTWDNGGAYFTFYGGTTSNNVNYLRLSTRTTDTGYIVYYDNIACNFGVQPLTSHANWHFQGTPGLIGIATSFGGSVQGRFQDTSATLQQDVYMDTLAGSGTNKWWIEFNITWIRGRMYFVVWDGPNSVTDRIYSFIVGNQLDTVTGELRYTTDGSTYTSLDTSTLLSTSVPYRLTLVKIASGPDRYDIYVNGVKKSSNHAGWMAQARDVQRVEFTTAQAYSSEDYYIDEIDCGWTQNLIPPTLISPLVTPLSGSLANVYNYTVIYTDSENNPPQSVNVTIDGVSYTMVKTNPADINYVDGCLYTYSTYLTAISHNYQFSCFDGRFTRATILMLGPTVTAVNTNAPVLSNGRFTPSRGYRTATQFTFLVNYTDADNNPPVQVNVILNSTTYAMAKQNPADSLYLDGCIFVFTTTLSVSGNYTVRFNCTDGGFATTIGPYSGLQVSDLLVTSGLLIFYPFDNNANDISGNNNNGVTSGVTYTTGIMGTAANFNGNAYVQSPVFNSNSNYTLCALFNAASFLTNSFLDSPLIDSDLGGHYGTGIGATSAHAQGIYNNGWVSHNYAFITSCWYYLVMTFDRSHGLITTYVNGSRIATSSFTFTVESSFRQFYVGYDPANAFYFSGLIDEIRIYNRVLSASEVAQLMRPWNMRSPVLSSGACIPASGNLSTQFTFNVTYSDPDNNAPLSMNVLINGTPYAMSKVVPLDYQFTDGCFYTYKTYLAVGSYNYQFTCSDGRFTQATSIVSGVTVIATNTHAPVLNNSALRWPKGYRNASPFTFYVDYWDADNNAPVQMNLIVNSTTYTMVKQNSVDNFYLDGCTYYFTTTLSLAGNYTYGFSFGDGGYVTSLGPFTGPEVFDLLVSNGLLVCYPFDYNANDISGNNNNGLASNLAYTNGIMGTAGFFGGTAYVRAPIYNSNSNYTLCALFKASAFTTNAYLDSPLIDSDYAALRFGTGIGATTTHDQMIYNNGWASHSYTFSLNTWYYLVVTFDRTHGVITSFVNGSRIGQSNLTFTVESLFQRFYVGYDPANGYYFNGAIDEIRIYNRVLSDAEIGMLLRPWNHNAPALSGSLLAPGSGDQTTLFTFTVTYTDPDNNMPAFMNVVINGTRYSMTKQVPSDNVYTDGCIYRLQTYFFSPGTYRYYFTCSDGIYSRSTTTFVGPTVTYYNTHQPALTTGSVAPSSGTNSTVFTYSITYTDADNTPPQYIYVTIDGTNTHAMAKQNASDNNYMDGCVYQYSSTLVTGIHVFYFTCSDGVYTTTTTPFSGPSVNTGVGLLNYIMTPGSTYTWIDATSGTRCTTLAGQDDANVGVALPWSFTFYGTNYSTIYICTNGFVSFAASSTFSNVAFPTTSPTLMIAPFWEDMQCSSPANIFYQTLTSPNRFVVEFQNYQTLGGTNVGTFEVVLYQSGLIYINYQSVLVVTGETVGLNYGLNTIYYNAYAGLTGGTSNFAIQFAYPSTGNPTAPRLTLPSAAPASGNQMTLFNYTIMYSDVENNTPSFVRVSINGTFFDMAKVNPADNTYTDGCLYQYNTMLDPGSYNYWFLTNDGQNYNQTVTYSGPTVIMVNTNAPVLSTPQAVPAIGFAGATTYTFTVVYTDADNNAPDTITITINGSAHALVKQNPIDKNYMDGCVYTYSTTLAPGIASYYFNASNAPFSASLGPFSGPRAVAQPYFNGMYAYYDLNFMGTKSATNYAYTALGGLNYQVSITDSYQGTKGENVDFSTRLLSSATFYWLSGTHDLLWIYPWMSLGSTMPITVGFDGDDTFVISSDTILQYGTGVIYAWVLHDLAEPGTVAYYEKSTGLLLNGTFYFSGGSNVYMMGLKNTNVAFYYATTNLLYGQVNPTMGSISNNFNFTVQYFNRNNVAPTNVTLVLDGTRYLMAKVNPAASNYTGGVLYYRICGPLTAGTHAFSFKTWAGTDAMQFPINGSSLAGPIVRNYQFSRLYDGLVSPNISDENAAYRFSVMYQDTQNATPSYMRLYLDGIQYAMVKNLATDDFTSGVEYFYINSTMAVGMHAYYFQAANATTTIRLPLAGSLSGPNVVRRHYTSPFSSVPPVIDGTYSALEWSAARVYTGTIPLYVLPGTTTIVRTDTYTMYIFNDGTNIYICIRIAGETYNNGMMPDVLGIIFDSNNNKLMDPLENAILIGTSPSMPFFATHDYFFNGSTFVLDTSAGGTEDGASAFSHTNPVNGQVGTYTFEMRFPYMSTDVHDLQMVPGTSTGFYIMFMDMTNMAEGLIPWFGPASTDPFGSLTPIFPPTSTSPPDTVVVQDAVGISITWRLSTAFTPGQYRVLRNGSVVLAWQAWPGNNTNIVVPVSTSIGLGPWNYTIQYNDTNTVGRPDSVMVIVDDLPVITGGAALNNTQVARDTPGISIDWTIHDTLGRNGMYAVLINGTSYIAWTAWSDGTNLAVPVDTSRGFGWFNYTIKYRDIYYIYGTDSHVFIYVHDKPDSNHPSDRIVIENVTGATIDWKLTDNMGPGQYRILINGTALSPWSSWINNAWINVPINANAGLGTKNYTIQFNDSVGYAGEQDTVLVLVNDLPVVYSAPVALMLPQNATSALAWTIRDKLTNGIYSVYINGTLTALVNLPWINNTAFTVPIDTNHGCHVFNYSIEFKDAHGADGMTSWVLITVDDLPCIIAKSSATVIFIQNATGCSIFWTLSDNSGSGNFTIYLGMVPVPAWTNQSWTTGVQISMPIDTNTGFGSRNYTIVFQDKEMFVGIPSSTIVIVNDIPVVVMRPANGTLVVQNATASFSWRLTDHLGGGTYTITRNGVIVPGYNGVAWTNNTPFTIPVNTNQGCGDFMYRLFFSNLFGQAGTTDRIDVHIEDIPHVVSPPILSIIMANPVPAFLTWSLWDGLTTRGTYSAYVNGLLIIANQSWSNSIPFFVLVPATTGHKTVTLYYWDNNGVAGASSVVTFTVEDFPIVKEAPLPFTFARYATGITLNWTLHDGIKGGCYSLYRNGIRILFNQSWTSDVALAIPISDTSLPEGRYNFTLKYWDSNANMGNASSVIITVSGDARSPFIVFWSQYYIYIILVSAGIVVVAVISIARYKKIKKASVSVAPKSPAEKKIPDRMIFPESTPATQGGSPSPPGTAASAPPGWPLTGPKLPPPGTALAAWDIAQLEATQTAPATPAAQAAVRPQASEQAPPETAAQAPVQAPSTSVEPLQAQQPVPITLVPSKPNFFCATCKQQYTFEGADATTAYACPTCNQLLARVVYCPSCNKKMALKQEDFAKSKGMQIRCTGCYQLFNI